MLTGASPMAHGVRSREQPLRRETVFHVMREAGMVSATAARAESSLGILISPHADKPGLAGSNLDSEVTEIACSMIEEDVNLLWVQLLDVDDAGHSHGPHSLESGEAAGKADANLRRILDAARVEGYSIMVLADHGQHPSSDGPHKGVHGTDMPEDLNVPLLWAGNGELGEALG
jgi:predicted AlkP superfamily pyrophosphatase or phosphodiesterase